MKKIDELLDKLNQISKNKRAKHFGFFIKLLDKLGFSGNSLSFIRALSGLLFFLIININFKIAFIIVVLGGFTDFFDGALARFQKKDGDRGKFVDMLCDSIIFSFFILGLIKINFISILNLSYFLFIIPALYIMISINKNELSKTDWIINPIARISYYKTIFEICFLLVIIFNVNRDFLNSITIAINIITTIHFSYHFYLFLTKKQK